MASPAPQQRVLVAACSPRGESSLGFVASMLRMQIALVTAQIPAQVDVVFFEDAAPALALAADRYDALVLLDTFTGFPPDFVVQGLRAPHAVVHGVHPLPRGIDWGRVERVARGGGKETLASAGLRYNVVPTDPRGGGYWDFAPAAGGAGGRPRALIAKGRAALAALAAGDAPEDAVADLDRPCSVMGQLAFEGCVGLRRVLR